MNSELRSELLGMVDRMAELSKRMQEVRREKLRVDDRVEAMRAKMVLEIAAAKDAKGRVAYRNETLRQAVLATRLKEDEAFRGLVERLRDLEDDLAALRIERERLEGRKQVLLADVAGI